MRVLAIDPGTTESGWVLLDGTTVVAHAVEANAEFLRRFDPDDEGYDHGGDLDLWVAYGQPEPVDVVLVEVMRGRSGMPWGDSLIETMRWSGRFEQAAGAISVIRISRDEVKRTLGTNIRTDGQVSAILADRYAALAGDPTGGRRAAVGTKARPGPLYGIRADAWQALALAVAHQDGARDIDTERREQAEAKAAKGGRR